LNIKEALNIIIWFFIVVFVTYLLRHQLGLLETAIWVK